MPIHSFWDLVERELPALALAFSSEGQYHPVSANFAHELYPDHRDSAEMSYDTAAEENGHRRRLIDVFTAQLADHIPLVRHRDTQAGSSGGAVDRFVPQASKPCVRRPADGAGHRALLSAGRHQDNRSRRAQVAERPGRRRLSRGWLAGLMDRPASTLAPRRQPILPRTAPGTRSPRVWRPHLLPKSVLAVPSSGGRWQPVRASYAGAPQSDLRADDDRWRPSSYAATPSSGVPDGHDRCLPRRGDQAVGACLNPVVLRGHDAAVSGGQDHAGNTLVLAMGILIGNVQGACDATS